MVMNNEEMNASEVELPESVVEIFLDAMLAGKSPMSAIHEVVGKIILADAKKVLTQGLSASDQFGLGSVNLLGLSADEERNDSPFGAMGYVIVPSTYRSPKLDAQIQELLEVCFKGIGKLIEQSKEAVDLIN